MDTREQSSNGEKTLGAIVRELAEDLSMLVRSEIALAKLEIKQAAAGMGAAAALFTAALFCLLFGLGFLLVTGVLALALVMPAWLATLIGAVILLVATGVLAYAGKKKMAAVEFVPKGTIESVKTDVESIRSEIARFKRTGE